MAVARTIGILYTDIRKKHSEKTFLISLPSANNNVGRVKINQTATDIHDLV